MADYNKLSDAQLSDWLANLAVTAAANSGTLGLTPPQIAQLNTANTAFAASLTNKIAKANDAMVATMGKNDQRASSLLTVRTLANQWQANPNVPDSLIQQLGLNVHTNDHSERPVYQPTDFVALGCDQVNSLKWEKNGNFPNTVYMIELQLPGGEWEILDSTMKAKYEHEGTTAGEQVSYRVYAQRGTKKSLPSNVATVFSSGMPGEGELMVA
ncbi:MAG: hypothetical protein JST30_11130 [Armatimonadetes bacterium]|nr:hypothetical protein [Armatimonadota bacterium]